MCIGEKWRLFIPASLAYGAEGGGTPETGINTVIFLTNLYASKQYIIVASDFRLCFRFTTELVKF